MTVGEFPANVVHLHINYRFISYIVITQPDHQWIRKSDIDHCLLPDDDRCLIFQSPIHAVWRQAVLFPYIRHPLFGVQISPFDVQFPLFDAQLPPFDAQLTLFDAQLPPFDVQLLLFDVQFPLFGVLFLPFDFLLPPFDVLLLPFPLVDNWL